MKIETVNSSDIMTLREYISNFRNPNTTPSSIMYYLNCEEDACEIEDLLVDNNTLYIEGFMELSFDTTGKIVNDFFQFENNHNIHGVKFF
jgi:hypothetical protein